MPSQKKNEKLTRVSAGTPCGDLICSGSLVGWYDSTPSANAKEAKVVHHTFGG
jgi:hypothetical protein